MTVNACFCDILNYVIKNNPENCHGTWPFNIGIGLLDSVGEGEGGMFQENSIKICLLSRWNGSPAQVGCMRQVLGPGALGRPSGIRSGEGGGRGDRDGEYMYIHGWFMSMYDKNHYNIVK